MKKMAYALMIAFSVIVVSGFLFAQEAKAQYKVGLEWGMGDLIPDLDDNSDAIGKGTFLPVDLYLKYEDAIKATFTLSFGDEIVDLNAKVGYSHDIVPDYVSLGHTFKAGMDFKTGDVSKDEGGPGWFVSYTLAPEITIAKFLGLCFWDMSFDTEATVEA